MSRLAPFKPNFKASTPSKQYLLLLTLAVLGLNACQAVPNAQSLPKPENPNYKTLSVTGRGIVKIPKTLAKVHLGVEVQGKTSQIVQQEVAQRASAVVELLKSRSQVKELETSDINLQPNYTYTGGKQKISGYTATNRIMFEIDPKLSGSLIDEAVKKGATRIDSVNLVAGNSAITEAQQEAIKLASTDANRQANAALSALNLKTVEVVGIQINQAQPPVISYPSASNQKLIDSTLAQTPIVAGSQQVEANVTLQIKY
ncbi:SIMPL domain-containing protein [Merismopedia glauca]|uniref:SIMPL domain-containing protein n=1 Tax=Merismopedia glauca CCAP 1448/3 TaxID=1296344 RepID=A0A2T1C256_9CYAN|nr:SIMPL domain-containing protein [Merismopedia glauca]PSB02258.1 hypothetical protein C7B64_14100 [Merismopedia glauca CCAP 1448/3]